MDRGPSTQEVNLENQRLGQPFRKADDLTVSPCEYSDEALTHLSLALF